MTNSQQLVLERLQAAGVTAVVTVTGESISPFCCACGNHINDHHEWLTGESGGCEFSTFQTTRVTVDGQPLSWGVFERLAATNFQDFCRPVEGGGMAVTLGNGRVVVVRND